MSKHLLQQRAEAIWQWINTRLLGIARARNVRMGLTTSMVGVSSVRETSGRNF